MRNGHTQASYIADDGKRSYATHTFDNRTDAVGWLGNERKLIQLGAWSPPQSPAKLQVPLTLRDYSEEWMKHRVLTPKTEELYRDSLIRGYSPVG